MKLAVLVENTTCRDDLTAEHGLSLYLEVAGKKILLDMGQTDAFFRNAQAMGIDLSQVDLAVLSHGHYDHGGGLQIFLQQNQKASICIHADAFGQHYNGTQKYIGLDPALQDHPRLIPVRGSVQLGKDLWLHDCNELGWQFESWGLTRKVGDDFVAEDFSHELYLQITEGERQILLNGCAHKGILNIASQFRPDVLIGGLHLNKQEDPQVLQMIARVLLENCGVCYTGHCTGQKQYTVMKNAMAQRLQPLSTGMNFEL